MLFCSPPSFDLCRRHSIVVVRTIRPLSLPLPPLPTISLLTSPGWVCAVSCVWFGLAWLCLQDRGRAGCQNPNCLPSLLPLTAAQQNACSPAWVHSPLPSLEQVPASDSCSALLLLHLCQLRRYHLHPRTQSDIPPHFPLWSEWPDSVGARSHPSQEPPMLTRTCFRCLRQIPVERLVSAFPMWKRS